MPRFHIMQFMVFTAIAAIVLAIVSRPSQSEMLVMIVIAVAAIAPFVLSSLPNSLESVMRNPPTDVDEQIAALERALVSRAWIKFGPLQMARFKLMQLYKGRKSFDEAIAHGREMLARYQWTQSMLGQIHLEIAECLECIGRDQESRAEQQ